MVSNKPEYETRNRKSSKIYLAARKVLPSPVEEGNGTDFCKFRDDTFSLRPSVLVFDFFFLFLGLSVAAIVDSGGVGNA
jgi:hypothetical protein